MQSYEPQHVLMSLASTGKNSIQSFWVMDWNKTDRFSACNIFLPVFKLWIHCSHQGQTVVRWPISLFKHWTGRVTMSSPLLLSTMFLPHGDFQYKSDEYKLSIVTKSSNMITHTIKPGESRKGNSTKCSNTTHSWMESPLVQ